MTKIDLTKEQCLRLAELEGDHPIAAGIIARDPEPIASYMEHIPTWRDHARRLLGFRRNFPDVDANEKAAIMPGWFRTVVNVHVSFGDRVRLLVSGRMRVDIENRCDVSVRDVVSASAVSIVSPFDLCPTESPQQDTRPGAG